MLSVRLSFLFPQGPFPWYEHPEPSRNAANTHLTYMLDPQGGSHPLSLRSHYRFKALGSRGRMQGNLRDAGVVGGVKGESLAWPLSRRSTKGAPKAWGNPQSRVGTAAQANGPRETAPRLAQRTGERARGRGRGRARWRRRLPGRAPQRGQPSEREGRDRYVARGTQTRCQWPGPSGPRPTPVWEHP